MDLLDAVLDNSVVKVKEAISSYIDETSSSERELDLDHFIKTTIGPWINGKHYCGDNPLHIAIKNENLGIVKLLIIYGADINYKCDGKMPIEVAIRTGNKQIVKYLLDRCAKIEYYEWTIAGLGKSMIQIAKEMGNDDIASMLEDHLSKKNKVKSSTPELSQGKSPIITHKKLTVGEMSKIAKELRIKNSTMFDFNGIVFLTALALLLLIIGIGLINKLWQALFY